MHLNDHTNKCEFTYGPTQTNHLQSTEATSDCKSTYKGTKQMQQNRLHLKCTASTQAHYSVEYKKTNRSRTTPEKEVKTGRKNHKCC